MLNIYYFILDTLEELQPISAEIGRHDSDLARQMRRAMTSIVLNVAEGSDSRGRNKQARYHTALGSTKETIACLDVGRVLRYIDPPSAGLCDRLDRIAATLAKLSR